MDQTQIVDVITVDPLHPSVYKKTLTKLGLLGGASEESSVNVKIKKKIKKSELESEPEEDTKSNKEENKPKPDVRKGRSRVM
jgi:hypothetical protein